MQRDKTTGDTGDLARANHPTAEQWMEWLYGETPPERHAALEGHLASCAQCESQIKTWKGAMENLDEWRIDAPMAVAKPGAHWSGGWKWAAAAVLVVAAFLAGRTNSTDSAPSAAIQAEVTRQVQAARTELARQFDSIAASNRLEMARILTDLGTTINEGRAENHQNVLAALKEMDAKWLAIYASFRRELETVAILTETGLKDTQQQLVQLSDFNETPR